MIARVNVSVNGGKISGFAVTSEGDPDAEVGSPHITVLWRCDRRFTGGEGVAETEHNEKLSGCRAIRRTLQT